MTLFQAIILAVIQGATEFIPVSSSGHLVLARSLFGWSDDGGLLFDVLLHAGSLAAILVYFLPEWRKMLSALKRRTDPQSDCYRLLPWRLVVATLPIVIAAPLLKDLLETIFRGQMFVGISMLATAAWFMASERISEGIQQARVKRENGGNEVNSGKPDGGGLQMSFGRALLIGLAQVVALLPGASRSGWTSGAGIAVGLARADAVRFAFFMAVPAIAGAMIFEGKDLLRGAATGAEIRLAAAGFIISLLVSLAAIHFCLRFFRTRTLRPFAAYLAAAGAAVVALALFR